MGVLERLIEAIEANTAALQGGATTAPPPKEKTTTKGKSKVTSDQLTELVQPLVQDEGTKAKVKDVLTAFGLKRLGEAKEDQFQGLWDAFTEIAESGGSSDEDDGLL